MEALPLASPGLAVRWRTLLGAIILVVLFIPIRRYTIPGGLPFELEPYRLLVALVVAGWIASLLVDPRVRLRPSGLEPPLLLFAVAVFGSLLANADNLDAVTSIVVKRLMFFASFLLVFYLIVSVVRDGKDADLLCRMLVGGGALLALLAAIESQTGYNLFNHLSGTIPLLERSNAPDAIPRGTRLRAYASAQHPIALGAAFAMLVPPAIYVARSSGRSRWWLAVGLLAVGIFSTVSRTAVVMLGVAVAVLLWLRPRDIGRFLLALVPALVAVQLALPGTFETFKTTFFPSGGVVAEQQQLPGAHGSGRLADIAPSLAEVAHRPVLGQGFGARITVGPNASSLLLDNQWLGTLLETGLVGFAGVLWLFLRFLRRASSAAKEDRSARGSLVAAIAASVFAYGVGMATYDAFFFVQVTFLLFILLALGAAVLAPDGEREAAALPAVPEGLAQAQR